jgi:hypothetical protein
LLKRGRGEMKVDNKMLRKELVISLVLFIVSVRPAENAAGNVQ